MSFNWNKLQDKKQKLVGSGRSVKIQYPPEKNEEIQMEIDRLSSELYNTTNDEEYDQILKQIQDLEEELAEETFELKIVLIDDESEVEELNKYLDRQLPPTPVIYLSKRMVVTPDHEAYEKTLTKIRPDHSQYQEIQDFLAKRKEVEEKRSFIYILASLHPDYRPKVEAPNKFAEFEEQYKILRNSLRNGDIKTLYDEVMIINGINPKQAIDEAIKN